MQGKNILITGASSGIGLETARQLAAQGAHILMVSRDPERGAAARAKIAESAAGEAPDLFYADLSSQESIRGLATGIRSHYSRIDVLINNAGAVFGQRELSVDGIEKTFAVNYLAPFLLTALLFELVRTSGQGRIITVSSEIHSGSLDFDNLQGERHYNFLEAYYQSKLENILFTYELARRAESTGVLVNALSPGPTRTGFGDNLTGLPRLFPLAMKRIPFLFAEPAHGARTPVYLASSPDVAGISGRFFMKERAIRTKAISYDVEVARRLWKLSEQLTHCSFEPAVAPHALLAADLAANLEEYSR
jgi:NAD(P)-dependent dehydrogenase (short-subunit alcohol dehydrogenase family)